MSMDDDFVVLIVCGMDNFIAFVDVVGNLVWMGAGACIMVGFLDDAVVVGIIGGASIAMNKEEIKQNGDRKTGCTTITTIIYQWA